MKQAPLTVYIVWRYNYVSDIHDRIDTLGVFLSKESAEAVVRKEITIINGTPRLSVFFTEHEVQP